MGLPQSFTVGKWLAEQKWWLTVGGVIVGALFFLTIDSDQVSAGTVRCEYAFGTASKTFDYNGVTAPECATLLFPTTPEFDLALCVALLVGAGIGAVGAEVARGLNGRRGSL